MLPQKIYNYTVLLFGIIRASFWRMFTKKIGERVYFMSGVKIMSPYNVSIGHDVYLNNSTIIGGQKGVTIGNYVFTAYNVSILSENHSYDKSTVPMLKQGFYGGPVVIEDDVWIGANAVILPNVRIGRGSIVGANAVVTKNIPSFSIVGGIPAKLIKKRFNPKKTKQAMKIKF